VTAGNGRPGEAAGLRVVVIGAGLAGLNAAVDLQRDPSRTGRWREPDADGEIGQRAVSVQFDTHR
jgi:2-polyprenyl-6-methoxyphenol hydroxylase-like FAD-dependent oxidoreductase